jgi:hypothetical protein
MIGGGTGRRKIPDDAVFCQTEAFDPSHTQGVRDGGSDILGVRSIDSVETGGGKSVAALISGRKHIVDDAGRCGTGCARDRSA